MRQYKPEGTMWPKFYGFKVDTVKRLMEEGTIVEAPVSKCDDELNLYLNLGRDIYGVISADEFEYSRDGKEVKHSAIVSRVSRFTSFKIKSMGPDEEGKMRAILSRKNAQKECYDNYVSKLKPGMVINARITRVEVYGAFCDIGCGIIALLPVENFCVARIRDAKSELKYFKNIKVVVTNIDEEGRILLSQKELLGTWEEEAAKFHVGDTVVGTVKQVEDYGAFIQLTPNLAGLAEPVEGVKPGDVVNVLIKGLVPDKMKVKLIIVDRENVRRPYTRLEYKIPENWFVSHWVYSPEGSKKLIESIIADEADAPVVEHDSTDSDTEAED